MEDTQKTRPKQEPNYYGLLSKRLTSTGEPISSIHLEAAASELRFANTELLGGSGEHFNTIFDALRKEYGLTEQQANNVIEIYAESNASKKAEKQKRAASRIIILKKSILGFAIASALGIAGGMGIAAYNATLDPLVKSEISALKTEQSELNKIQEALRQRTSNLERDISQSYRQKMAEIEKIFFGKLETLTSPDNSTLTSFERKIYTKDLLDLWDNNSKLTVYNQIDPETGTRIFGRINLINGGTTTSFNRPFYTPILSIIRFDKEEKILSVHTYKAKKVETEEINKVPSMHEVYSSATPSQTLLFLGREAIKIDHESSAIEKYLNGEKVYGNNVLENIQVYQNMAEKLLAEFKTLSNRGPLNISPKPIVPENRK